MTELFCNVCGGFICWVNLGKNKDSITFTCRACAKYLYENQPIKKKGKKVKRLLIKVLQAPKRMASFNTPLSEKCVWAQHDDCQLSIGYCMCDCHRGVNT